MAVVILRKNENITNALLRFHQQVLREGIFQEIIRHRYFQSKGEAKRLIRLQYQRLRRRRKARNKKKPRTVVPLKTSLF